MKTRLVSLAEIGRGCPNGHALCLRAACYLEPKGGRTMELRLTLRMDNAAFEPDPAQEVRRILGRLAEECEETGHLEPGWKQVLFDLSGNRVGLAEIQ